MVDTLSRLAQAKEATSKGRHVNKRKDNGSSDNGTDVWMTQQQSLQS